MLKLQMCQEIITTAKDTTFLGGPQQPRIQLCLAVVDSQEKIFTWQASTAKEIHTANKKILIYIANRYRI
jgi:hypothetical protein